MNTTKKTMTALSVMTLCISAMFSMDVNKEISRYTAEQQILINAYKLMIDGEEDTMDKYTSDENDKLIEHLSMADGDWDILWDDLGSNYDLQGNEPEAIYLRYLIDNTFKKKLDITPLNELAKALKAKELSSVKTYNTMQNVIVACVKGLNPKNKSDKLETLECVTDLAIKLSDSANLTSSVGYALQDNTVKNYILNGAANAKTEIRHEAIADTICSDLKNRFKVVLDTAQLDIIVSVMKSKNIADEQIIRTAENFLSDFCKELKNPKTKNKKNQDSLEVIASLFTKLSASDNPINTVALTLSDPGIKAYILGN